MRQLHPAPARRAYVRRGIYMLPVSLAALAGLALAGCADLLGQTTIEGKWSYKSASSIYEGTESGTIDFKSDGMFEMDVVNTATGHRIGGGEYTHQSSSGPDGGMTRIHFTWAQMMADRGRIMTAMFFPAK